MLQLFGKFSDMSKVELALACDAVEYGEICCNNKGNTDTVVYFLPLWLKLALHLSASHCHLEARDP